MKEECWIYRNKCLEFPPDGYYGFTYIIKDILNNKIYVGKKAFTYKSKKTLSKKAKKLPENKGKRVRGTKDIAEINFHLCRPALFEYN